MASTNLIPPATEREANLAAMLSFICTLMSEDPTARAFGDLRVAFEQPTSPESGITVRELIARALKN